MTTIAFVQHKRIGKDGPWSVLMHYSGIPLEGLNKSLKSRITSVPAGIQRTRLCNESQKSDGLFGCFKCCYSATFHDLVVIRNYDSFRESYKFVKSSSYIYINTKECLFPEVNLGACFNNQHLDTLYLCVPYGSDSHCKQRLFP
jgi:hypothetical protein